MEKKTLKVNSRKKCLKEQSTKRKVYFGNSERMGKKH